MLRSVCPRDFGCRGLTLYAPVPDFFDDEIIELLDGVCREITFALRTIADEERRKEAETALGQVNIYTVT
jgi:GAF domain-containing protein